MKKKCPDCGSRMAGVSRVREGIDIRLVQLCVDGADTLLERGLICYDCGREIYGNGAQENKTEKVGVV